MNRRWLMTGLGAAAVLAILIGVLRLDLRAPKRERTASVLQGEGSAPEPVPPVPKLTPPYPAPTGAVQPSPNEMSSDEVSHPTSSSAVYNAVFTPTSGSRRNALLDGQRTQVDFYIGKPDEASAILPEYASLNPKIASKSGTEKLTITFTCGFCDGTQVQQQTITYSPATGQKSSDAKFSFVPKRGMTRNGMASLSFQIETEGYVLDNIVLDIYVEDAAAGLIAQGGSTVPGGVSLGGGANVVVSPGARAADLTITCFEHNNLVAVQLEPGKRLSELFKGRHMQDATHPRVFDTGITVDELSRIVGRNYQYLSLLSGTDQELEFTKELTGDPAASIKLSGETKLDTEKEEKPLLDQLYKQWQPLYYKLFIQSPADKGLQELMRDFDAYSGSDSPILIRIDANGINIPWQFLYPPVAKGQAKDPHKFWGFRYEIVVDPLGKPAGRYPNEPLQYGNGPLLLAKYHAGDPDGIDISTKGEQFGSTIGFKRIIQVDSRNDFLKALKASGPDAIQVLVTFTHATGSRVLRSINGETVVAPRSAGPELRFSDKEVVTLEGLDELSNDLPAEHALLLSNRPLVFLDGCETGADYEKIDATFPAEFLRMGARGVIATEAPIFTAFGYDFGVALMGNLKSGQTASLALLKTRLAFLEKPNYNPLGLLYSYYGGVKASISLQ